MNDIAKILDITVRQGWHTMPKDSPEYRVYSLALELDARGTEVRGADPIEDKLREAQHSPEVQDKMDKIVSKHKPKKKGKKK